MTIFIAVLIVFAFIFCMQLLFKYKEKQLYQKNSLNEYVSKVIKEEQKKHTIIVNKPENTKKEKTNEIDFKC